MSRRYNAFTLSELLIVVAIIAILAAIAVPNFLDAQARSKVARVHSDLRSIATAMEAYAVDQQTYPIPADPYGAFLPNPIAATSVSPFETRVPVLLTTPIAYLSTRPEDPFATTRHSESRLYMCITLDYVKIRQNNAPVHNWLNVWNEFHDDLMGSDMPSQIAYVQQSFGPDFDHDLDAPHAALPSGPHVHGRGTLYDPTNGTTSSGDILYFGPGFGFRP